MYLLGETGYAGRLGRALVEPGLAYSVYTTLEEEPGAPGFLAVRTATSRADTREALRRIREVIDTAARGAFIAVRAGRSQGAICAAARRSAATVPKRRRERRWKRADPRRSDPQSLTLAQLNATARRLFARGAPVVIVLGPGMD